MTWSKYGEFLIFAVVLILIPGPDFAVVTKNTIAGGRRRGRWTALGVATSNLVQGTAASSESELALARALDKVEQQIINGKISNIPTVVK